MNRRQFLAATIGGVIGAGATPIAVARATLPPRRQSEVWRNEARKLRHCESWATVRMGSEKSYGQYEGRQDCDELVPEAEITCPWQNPVDVLREWIATVTTATPDPRSFAEVWRVCEPERISYILSGPTAADDVIACLKAAKSQLLVQGEVAYLNLSIDNAGSVTFFAADDTDYLPI